MSRVYLWKGSIEGVLENIFIREGIMNIGEIGIGWFLKGVGVVFWIVAYISVNYFSIGVAWEWIGLRGWEAFIFSVGVLGITSIAFVGYILNIVEREG